MVVFWNARGQEARALVALQPSDWFVFEPNLDVDFESQSQSISKEFVKGDKIEGLVSFVNAEFSSRAYFVALYQFDTSTNWVKHVLQVDATMSDWSLTVSGQKVEAPFEGSRFIDVSSLIDEQGRALVVLTRNPNRELRGKNSVFSPKLVQGISFRNVAIVQVLLNDDSFFGGKKIEVHVENFTSEAVDGKLVGRIYNADGSSLLIENNNCAYARANMEFSLGISLPESETLLKEGEYIIEVELLDKEKGEQVVDAFQVPVRL